MSFIDNFTNIKKEYTMNGFYVPFLPPILGDNMYRVMYDELDAEDKTFEDVITNIPDEVMRMTIKTVTPLDYKTNAFFKAQDGTLYQIRAVKKREPKGANRQALRIRRQSPQAEFELLLVEYDDKNYDEE